MKTTWLWACVLSACGGMVEVAAPVGEDPRESGEAAVLMWVGRGETERWEDGSWVRDDRFDYEFSVEQRRYAGRWRSFKTMRRTHPDYDGSAGPREQVLWFAIDYRTDASEVRGVVRSRLGEGEVTSDPEFRRAEIVIRPQIPSQAPFDTFLIRQHYRYEDGLLEETVELVDRGDGAERPWVRNHERARLFVPGTFVAEGRL